MMGIPASVLVCTRDRPGDLVLCVRSLVELHGPEHEILVLDQSTTDASERAVREWIGRPPHLTLIRSDTRGKSVALNQLLRRARGDILAFTDDDTVVPRDWLTRIVQTFEQMPEADILYGQVFAGPAEDPRATATPTLAFGERRVLAFGEAFGMGANMAFRRSLVDRVIGYDEALGPGGPLACSEDFDLLYRAQRAGAVAVAEPSVQLVHRAGRTQEEWARVMQSYGKGDAAYLLKHARCGDWSMVRMLVSRPAYYFGRLAYRRARGRRQTAEAWYLRGYWAGIRESLRFGVDRTSRLYVAPR